MNPEEEASRRHYWLRQAQSVRRRVNLAWWIETSTTPLMVVSLAGATVLLLLRREMPVLPLWQMIACCSAALLAVGLVTLFIARRRFESTTDSLVRIEANMRLRNALSAATAGVTPWPEAQGKIHAGLHWRWPRLVVPVLGSLALLAAGLWVPVSAKSSDRANGSDQPQSWSQIEAELDLLAQEEVVDEPYLEETKRQLDELKAQEEEQWFSHSSLEATDSLKRSHQSETQRVERELGRAENAITALEKAAGAMGQAEKERLMDEFDQALQGLQNGAMKPNAALMEQLKGMDLKNLGNLPPDQLQQLKDNLAKHGKCLGQCNGGEGNEWDEDLMADGDGQCDGDGKGNCDGKDGPGKGGVNRGPGHADGVLGRQRDGLEIGKMEGLSAQDLSRSGLGDLLELQQGEHDVDLSASAITAGGDTSATGKGGDRVWRESLDPDEQRAMKRFFD